MWGIIGNEDVKKIGLDGFTKPKRYHRILWPPFSSRLFALLCTVKNQHDHKPPSIRFHPTTTAIHFVLQNYIF